MNGQPDRHAAPVAWAEIQQLQPSLPAPDKRVSAVRGLPVSAELIVEAMSIPRPQIQTVAVAVPTASGEVQIAVKLHLGACSLSRLKDLSILPTMGGWNSTQTNERQTPDWMVRRHDQQMDRGSPDIRRDSVAAGGGVSRQVQRPANRKRVTPPHSNDRSTTDYRTDDFMTHETAPHECGYDTSRWNRLRYGAMVNAVAPCRRDACKLYERCPLLKGDDRRPPYGHPCPIEQHYVSSYQASFMDCYQLHLGIDEPTAMKAGEKLALLELRRDRLSSRLKDAWAMPDRDGAGAAAFYRELGIVGRYMTALDREMAAVWESVFGPAAGIN